MSSAPTNRDSWNIIRANGPFSSSRRPFVEGFHIAPSRKRKQSHDEAAYQQEPRRSWQGTASQFSVRPVIPEDETVHLAEQILHGLLQARSRATSETASDMRTPEHWKEIMAAERQLSSENELLASPEIRDVMEELGYDFATMAQFRNYTNELLRYQRAVLVRAAQAEVDLKKAFWFQRKLDSMRGW